MERRDAATGLVVAGVTIGYLLLAMGLPDRGATRSGMPPSTYPIIVGALLIIAAAVLVGRTLLRRPPAEPGSTAGERPRTRFGRLSVMFVAAWVYLWLLGLLGFLVASTLFLAFGARLVAGAATLQDWRQPRAAVAALVFGGATSAAIYLVFGQILGVLLPPGLLPMLMGW